MSEKAQDLRKALRAFLDAKGGESTVRLLRLWNEWERIVGEEIAELVVPLGHRKKILVLGASDNMAQQEATYYAPEILYRVHEFLGEELFERVQIDLLLGKEHVARQKVGAPPIKPWQPPTPKVLGNLLGNMNEDSPVARCYEKYVRFFAGKKK